MNTLLPHSTYKTPKNIYAYLLRISDKSEASGQVLTSNCLTATALGQISFVAVFSSLPSKDSFKVHLVKNVHEYDYHSQD